MKCRVIKLTDGVSVIHPAPKSKRPDETEQEWLERVFKKATTGELEGQPFIDIDDSQLPSREDRNAWELNGNKVVINPIKAKKDREERLIREEISKIQKEGNRQQAITNLEARGELT